MSGEVPQIGISVYFAFFRGGRKPIGSFFWGSGGAISCRSASNTTLNERSYFFSISASLRARSLCVARSCRRRAKLRNP